ncbi:MAG: hypothetical protein JO082_15825 [Mycobacterium sp.]|nr:hypothetical protein [Mycobacterium sp.]MBV9723371.1 hypothetical protein [Mycobacterium sp.]
MTDGSADSKLPQWEYTWFHAEGADALNDLMRKANALGQQGWEMVNFTLDEQKPLTAVGFFKRPLQEVQPEPRRRFL